MGIMLYKRVIRANSIPRFVRRMSERHPELLAQVRHEDFLRMANRDHVHVRIVPLPSKQLARTFVVGENRFVRVNRSLSRDEQTLHGMHELCHVWRDHVIAGSYYSDELTGGASCEFADIFAWKVTSTPTPLPIDIPTIEFRGKGI